MSPFVSKLDKRQGWQVWHACDINARDPSGKRFGLRRSQRVFISKAKVPDNYRGNHIFVAVYLGVRVVGGEGTGYTVVFVSPRDRITVAENGVKPFCLMLSTSDIETYEDSVCPMKQEDENLTRAVHVVSPH